MSGFLEHLRPGERRLVVVIGVTVIVVLNVVFVWPHFGDWNKTMRDLHGQRVSYTNYLNKIAMDLGTNGYQAQLKKFQDQNSAAVPLANELQLQKTVYGRANECRVNVNNSTPVRNSNTQTNDFEEQSINITVDSGEKELVDFLYNIGNDSSMIRVRQLNLRPMDASRYRLRGTVTLTANYQKKAPEKPAPAAAPATAKTPVAATPRPTLTPTPKKPAK